MHNLSALWGRLRISLSPDNLVHFELPGLDSVFLSDEAELITIPEDEFRHFLLLERGWVSTS
jgi:hypothetical protein